MIFVISSRKASGLSTNAWASESGLSSTMAMSISSPSFLMRVVLPCCILFKIATALFSHTFRSHSSAALWASSPVCAGAVRIVGVPSALRKGLSVICGVGKEVTAEATRRRSLSWISVDRDVFCVMAASALIHIWLKVWPAFGSMYHLFQTALCDHWGALRLISAKSRFISYSLSRSSSSSSVVSRWIHRCLTAPSMCRGHPVGICDSSRSPSPFCSIISPSIGTSIEVFRLIRGRLHCHGSGESKPRLASSATAGKEGWSLMISASSLIMSRRPCMGSGVPCPELGGGPLVAVVSWNQVGRTDLTPVTLPESVLLTLSRRRLWYIGGIIHAGTNMTTYWTFHATWRSWFLKSGVMHRTCPSMTRTYDSVRSKEAVTLKPK